MEVLHFQELTSCLHVPVLEKDQRNRTLDRAGQLRRWSRKQQGRGRGRSCPAASAESWRGAGSKEPWGSRDGPVLQSARGTSMEMMQIPESPLQAEQLLEELVEITQKQGNKEGMNVVAFSGGVDSSLTAYLVLAAFGAARSLACIGRSAALPQHQLILARQVAGVIGIPLKEVETAEGTVPDYVANNGTACFHCKTTLYSTLAAVAAAAGTAPDVVLFNGTNADDVKDPTRLGLLAAAQANVASPLAALPKAAVRVVARAAGLPNWDLAAAPCLRSRLDFGVPATPDTLARVEIAERQVRALLELEPSESMRVRILAGNQAVLELESGRLQEALQCRGVLDHQLSSLQLDLLTIRTFRSGALSQPQVM